ncbi:uncharacterized protein LOC121720020 [Alosa sapidissima]|uniref:uncharacterized protein LOC121720020 n=1 Tax=Alosa sapidissima TaxID=34773 RepID=UPI001C09593C|nr:uncharacterized protein LOC121720020 [Alosa sapidissima]
MNYISSATHDGLQSLLTSTASAFSTHTYRSALKISTTVEYEDYTIDDEDTGVCNYTRHSASFLPALYSIYFVLGVLGNGLVVWVISMGVRLRSMTDVCLLNLALADLLLVSSLPFLAHQARDAHALLRDPRQHRQVLAVKLSNSNATAKNVCGRDYEDKGGLRAGAIFKMNVLGFVIPLTMLIFCYSRILLTLLLSKSPCLRCSSLKAYLSTASGSVYSVTRNTSVDERSTAI